MFFDWLYEPLLMLFGFMYFPHFIMRLRHAADKRQLLLERLGYFTPQGNNDRVLWIHAVSVGEVMAAREFLRAMKILYPDWQVLLSTTTPTGQRIAQTLRSEFIRPIYFPLDLFSVLQRALNMLRPKVIVLMETEIWPNLIRMASKRGIPIGIINGRISKRSFKRYRRIQPWLSTIMQKLSFCLVRNETDKKYFLSLGVREECLQVTGNMKFDVETPRNQIQNDILRESWHLKQNPVLVAGSTHEGEEAILIRIFRRLRSQFPGLRLVLAPRHPERAEAVKRLVGRSALRGVFSSRGWNDSNGSFDVLIVDQMGVLSHYYGLADLVFMGGSFIPRGGQNPIEPARERKTILHGPHVFNFQDVYDQLDTQGGAVLAADEGAAYESIVSFLSDRTKMQTFGMRAYEIVDQLKGATQRNLHLLQKWLEAVS